MKRSWAWPVLMAVLLPGGLLLAAAWLLARARVAPDAAGRQAGDAASRPWPSLRGLDALRRGGAGSSRRWEWPTASGRPHDAGVQPETLH